MLTRGQQAGRAAADLGLRETGDAREGRVDLGDQPVRVDHHDALVAALEHHAGLAQRPFGLLVLGDVGVGARHDQGLPRLAALHDAAARQDPAPVALFGPAADLHHMGVAFALQVAFDRGHGGRQVFRVHDVGPPVGADVHLARLEAQHGLPACAHHEGIAGQVPVPVTLVGTLQHPGQLLFALAQGGLAGLQAFLVSFQVGDVACNAEQPADRAGLVNHGPLGDHEHPLLAIQRGQAFLVRLHARALHHLQVKFTQVLGRGGVEKLCVGHTQHAGWRLVDKGTGGGIGQQVVSLPVFHEHGIRRARDDRVEQPAAALQSHIGAPQPITEQAQHQAVDQQQTPAKLVLG